MAEVSLRNRTGLGMSPVDGPRVTEGARHFGVESVGGLSLRDMRQAAMRHAPPLGHVPPPTTIKGAATTVTKLLQGKDASELVDRLGQRLAYERTGVRLYEAVLTRMEVHETWDGGPDTAQLRQIVEDEASHVQLVHGAMVQLGIDPTALTPAANASAVMSLGFIQLLADPRTDMVQCVEALLSVELTDLAGWELLIELTAGLGLDTLTQTFAAAQRVETDHTQRVRGWMQARVARSAGATSLK